jgi:hypothetical protein
MKRSSGKLVSNASVYNDAGNGMISMMMFQDYSKGVESNQVRVTEKAVKEQHSRVVANIDAIVADAKAFYAAKG